MPVLKGVSTDRIHLAVLQKALSRDPISIGVTSLL